MAVEQSILKGTKKILGLGESYDAFDHDVITHINSAFFNLYQLGIGPEGGFAISGVEEVWEDFVDSGLNVAAKNALQSYIYLYVRNLFDPPGTPHHIKAVEDQKAELAQRLLTERELIRWTVPQSSLPSLP